MKYFATLFIVLGLLFVSAPAFAEVKETVVDDAFIAKHCPATVATKTDTDGKIQVIDGVKYVIIDNKAVRVE